MSASIYTKTAMKNSKGVIYAFGRDKELETQSPNAGGYYIFKLCENYDGRAPGGISKTWRYVAKDLSYIEAVKLMNKRLGREEFIIKGY